MSVPSAHIFCLSHSWFQAQTKEEVAVIKKKRKEKKRKEMLVKEVIESMI